MCQRGGQLSHHVDAIDVRQISLELSQPFALLLGALSFRYIHRDADVFTQFSRAIVMSDGAQESDAAVGMANPELGNVVVCSRADCILKSCPYNRLVFRVNGVPKTFEC